MGKHRDSKGRALRSGESQRENGQYMYRYTDCDGNRRTVYSWRLVASDRTPAGKKDSEALRELEKKIQKDLDDRIHIGSANTITLDDEFQTFMEIRADLKETTRVAYIELYKNMFHLCSGREHSTTFAILTSRDCTHPCALHRPFDQAPSRKSIPS